MSNDNIHDITTDYKKRMSAVFRKYDEKPIEPVKVAPTPVELTPIDTQPIAPQDVPTSVIDSWTVYSFTLPVHTSKKIAFGFESKKDAQDFINTHLVARNDDGLILRKGFDIGDIHYTIYYDVMKDSRTQINVFANPSKYTTVGNDKETVYKEWAKTPRKVEIIQNNQESDPQWIG